MPTLIKNGNIVNTGTDPGTDFLNQGYVQATQADLTNASTAAAKAFAGAPVGAEGTDLRNEYAQAARVAGAGIPGLTGPTTNPVSSTTDTRNAETIVKTDAGGIETELDKYLKAIGEQKTYGQTQEGIDAMTELNRVRRALGETTAEEEASIAQSGAEAGSKFRNLIAQAEEDKRLGMPKALIGAGQRGGLMSSQFAGVAAATPIVGETFFGAGGKLEEVKSAYDRSITALRVQQIEAINEAQALARKAIRTGKAEDYKLLEGAYDRARTSYEEGNKLQTEKLNAIAKVQEMSVKGTEFAQKQEDRTIESAVGTFVTLDENGDIVRPDSQSLKSYAEANGIDPLRFATGINKKIDELEKLSREQRKSALDEISTKASIKATEALTEQRRLDAIKSEQMLPLEVQELQSRIRENNAQTAKALAGLQTDTGYQINDMLDGYANYFAKHYGDDAKLDTDVYLKARNEFVQQFKTNKDYYDKLFIRNYPPAVLLNNAPVGDIRHDPRATAVIEEARKAGSAPVINFSMGSAE